MFLSNLHGWSNRNSAAAQRQRRTGNAKPAQHRPRHFRPALEALEDRIVPTAYVFVDFGDNFPGANHVLTTTVGAIRDVAPAQQDNNGNLIPNTVVQGPQLTNILSPGLPGGNFYPDGTSVNFTSFNNNAATRAQLLADATRAFLSVDVTVVGLTATPQTLADGRVVTGAASLADVTATLRGNNTITKDVYVIVAIPAIGPNNDNPINFVFNRYGGKAPGGTIRGETTDIDAASNSHDDLVLNFRNDANTIVHEAGHALGLRHGVTTAAPNSSAINNLLPTSEVMSYLSSPNETSIFFSRYPMVRGDGNTSNNDLLARRGQATPFGQLRDDPNVGQRRNQEYISGTGANDIIRVTKGAGNTANVTVSAFNDSKYKKPIFVPGTTSFNVGELTYSYTVNLDRPLLIQAGLGDDRIILDGTLVTQVTVDGGAGTDSITVDDSLDFFGSFRYTVTNSTLTDNTGFGLTYSNAEDLTLIPTTGPSTIVNVESTAAATPVTLTASGNFNVNVGKDGSVQAIKGDINVTPTGTGMAALTVNASADLGGTVTLTKRLLSMAGVGTIVYPPKGLSAFTISTGYFGNDITVKSTPSAPVRLNTGIDRDVVNVSATNGPLTVNGQSGADEVIVGEAHRVQGIGGPLTITNELGYSDVIVDDSANPDPRTEIILYHENIISGDFTAISGLTPGGIKLGRLDLKSLTLSAGFGGNTFRIHDTLPAFYYDGNRIRPTLTSVNTGARGDTVIIDGTTGALDLDVQGAGQLKNSITVGAPTGGINGISGRIDITGGTGVVNSLSINDAASTVRRDYVIGANFVQRLDKARIGYEHLSELTLQAGAQKDNIVVQDTMQVGPGRSTTIALSGGNDVIDVSRTTGTLSIYPGVSSVISVGNAASSLDNIRGAVVVTPPGAGNSVKLILDDRAVTTTQQFDVAPSFFGTSFRRSGAADISVLFNPLASFQWFGGSGSDTFHVNALATTTTALLDGGSGSNLLTGPDLANRWRITGANAGMLNDNITFSSMQSLSGGANDDAFIFSGAAAIDGSINGLGGVNTLDYSAYTASTALSALAAWYKGEGNTDDAVSGNNGVPVGNVQYAPGMVGQAFSFNGVDSYVQVPNAPALESANISVEAWVNGTNLPIFAHILAKGDNSNLLPSYSLGTGDSGGLEFEVSNGTTYTLSQNPGTAIWDGNWHHVVGTYDGASVRLYVDGVEIGSGSPSNIVIAYGLSNTNDLFIGSYATGEPRFDFPGRIDEPSVYNRALSAAEIQSIFAAGSAGKTALESSGVTVNLQLSTATAIRDGISNIQNVIGSAGNDILVGNGGRLSDGSLVGNVLSGGPGRDILIAGANHAGTLNGGAGEDILIAGWTDYDNDAAAIDAIMAQWARTDIGYDTRVANLQSGANGVPALNANSVHSNGQANKLTGGTDQDLFFRRLASELLDWDSLTEMWVPIAIV